jgi:membrane protein
MKPLRRYSLAEWWSLIKDSVSAWVDDYAPSMGAALSYYSVFSMAPLLLIVISIAGLVFGQDAARGELFGQLRSLMGAEAASAVEATLAGLSKPSTGITSTIISVVVLLIGATSVFGELQDALDRIWRAPARNKASGLWGLLRSRLLSFGMILGIAFLLMVSLVLSAAVSALGKWWGGFFGSWEVLAQIVNVAVGFGLTAAVFAMIYKIMPRVSVQWHDVWLGAATTSLLFTVGRFLIGLYIGKSGVASGFGAAGSVAIIFVWVYYSAQIFLLGAEFTWVYATRFGSMQQLKTTAENPRPQPVEAAPLSRLPELSPTLRPVEATYKVTASALVEVGASLGAALVVRFLIPRLLRAVAAVALRRTAKRHAVDSAARIAPRNLHRPGRGH